MTLTPQQATELLKEKVAREYEQGINHVRKDRERKQDVLKHLIYKDIKPGIIRVNLLLKNIKLEHSLYLSDEVLVTLISGKGVIADNIMKNANEVLKYDNDDMDMREVRRTIRWHNALYGIACTTIIDYDDERQQPIVDIIHPLNIVPDPENYTGSKMRWCGFSRRVPIEAIKNNDAYTIPDGINLENTDFEIDKIEKSESDGVGKEKDETLCDIYDHFTTYQGKKYLTTWINERSECIRCIELEKCSEKELKKPSETSYPFQLHRRQPLYKSFFGVSVADEVLQYQDPISILTNLKLKQARLHALGPDKYISNSLGVNLAVIASQEIGGRIIPVNTNGTPVNNQIFYDQMPNPSQFPSQMIQELEQRAEGETGKTALVFGQSLQGSQTKAEVQELMQNTNQSLGEVGNNYLRGEKDYWEAHYRAYIKYMSPKKKKVVAMYKKNGSYAKSFLKSEFANDENIVVYVESKTQIKKQNERDFAKLNAVAGLLLQNMQPGYAMNEFLRKILKTLDVYELDATDYIVETPDEMRAKINLELLNNNVDVELPSEGEDYMTYIEIYKQALDTEAKHNALSAYMEAYMNAPKNLPIQGQSDPTASAMSMNMVNSQLTNNELG